MHELGIEVDHASMMSLVASHQTGQSGSRGHACGSPASPTILAGATATSATASPAGETAAPAFGGHHGDATGGSGVPQREHQEGAGPGTRPQADAGATDHPPAGPLSVPVPQMVAKRSLELHSLRNPLCARGEVVLLRTYQVLRPQQYHTNLASFWRQAQRRVAFCRPWKLRRTVSPKEICLARGDSVRCTGGVCLTGLT